MAVREVKQAKEFGGELGSLYLLSCIRSLWDIIADKNPYSHASSDLRYRAFVIAVLKEYQKQELPDFGGFFRRVLLGRYK